MSSRVRWAFEAGLQQIIFDTNRIDGMGNKGMELGAAARKQREQGQQRATH
jgi:hypothetical protein